jgi:DNA-binding MarR family transcriptional regulator
MHALAPLKQTFFPVVSSFLSVFVSKIWRFASICYPTSSYEGSCKLNLAAFTRRIKCCSKIVFLQEMKSMTIASRDTTTITPRQLEVLTILSRREHWSVGELASALSVSSAAATKAIARLQRKGLVRRSENALDRRSVDVRITRSGSETIRLMDGHII